MGEKHSPWRKQLLGPQAGARMLELPSSWSRGCMTHEGDARTAQESPFPTTPSQWRPSAIGKLYSAKLPTQGPLAGT